MNPDEQTNMVKTECLKFRKEMKVAVSEFSSESRSEYFKKVMSEWRGEREAEPQPQHIIETVSDGEHSQAMLLIMNELKFLRTEITQMKTHMEEAINGVLEKVATNFEKQLSGIIMKIDKQNSSIVMVKDDASRVKDKLEQSRKREKVTKTTQIHMETNARKNNLMFFGVPEKDDTTSCEQIILSHLKTSLHIEDPCRIYNTKRVGLKRKDSPRPIVTTFADPTERIRVWGKRHNLNKPFGISADFPPEIRLARTLLVPQMKRLKKEGRKVGIGYPAQLWCDDSVVRSIDIADVVLD